MAPPRADFNPPAPRGARLPPMTPLFASYIFQSTRPSRGETITPSSTRIERINFNPPAPRGARPRFQRCLLWYTPISIHPPLAGRDARYSAVFTFGLYFNPPAPRGARPQRGGSHPGEGRFQSTRPSRGETGKKRYMARVDDISIHPPLAGRDKSCSLNADSADISIHPPLAGRDPLSALIAVGV